MNTKNFELQGMLIKNARIKRGVTKEEMSRRLGRPFIQKSGKTNGLLHCIEKGQKGIPPKRAHLFVRELGIKYCDLLGAMLEDEGDYLGRLFYATEKLHDSQKKV